MSAAPEGPAPRARRLLADDPVARGAYALVAMFVCLGAAGFVFQQDPDSVQTRVFAMGAANGAFLLLCLLPLLRPAVDRPHARDVLVALGRYALFLPVWFAFSFLVNPLILHLFGVEPEQQEHLAWMIDPATPTIARVLGVAFAVLLAPLVEEILFRGHFWGALEALGGRGLALGATSIVFGIVHGLEYALPLALLGLFFGALRLRTGSLLAPIVAHAFHNAWVLGLLLTWPDAMTSNG